MINIKVYFLWKSHYEPISTNIQDLHVLGSDTAGTTTEWEMAELLHNPKLLKKAQQELDQVIGKGRQVEESNFDKLPYLSVNCEKKPP